MALMDYSTKVPVVRTIEQIEKVLLNTGAERISKEYADGEVTGFSFVIRIGPEQRAAYSLPAEWRKIKGVLEQQVDRREIPRSALREGQAERTAWRILLHWLKAQLALIETSMAQFDQVMLPFLTFRDGRTMYEHVVEAQYDMDQLTGPTGAGPYVLTEGTPE